MRRKLLTVVLASVMLLSVATGAAADICAVTAVLTFTNLLGERQILCRNVHSADITVITTPDDFEETAHHISPCKDRLPYT